MLVERREKIRKARKKDERYIRGKKVRCQKKVQKKVG